MSTGEREMEAGSAWRPWPRFRITKGPKSGISGRRGRWTRALGVFFVDHVRLGQGGKPVPRISLSRAALGRLQEVDNSRFPWHQLAGYNSYKLQQYYDYSDGCCRGMFLIEGRGYMERDGGDEQRCASGRYAVLMACIKTVYYECALIHWTEKRMARHARPLSGHSRV